MMIINTTINGKECKITANPNELLIDVLRREGYFGVKRGCSEGSCGSCVVLIDYIPRKSCIMFIGQIEGHHVTTIEGLGTPEKPHSIQEAFVDEAGIQCGFCIPGMILSAYALLRKNLNPT
ncbi:MAG: (2Fe-2S)-binding protein, partial [Candidatus Hodarchaeota archaeon]